MTSNRVGLIALVIAIVALVASAAMLIQASSMTADIEAARSGFQIANERIGVAALEPAHPLDVPNVARDPADVPPPITRTEPKTVSVTLTIEEVTAELADGATYSFWTFNGTVPGPMLRVMEGDTIEFTLDVPGDYLLVDHALYRVGKGAGGILQATGQHDESIYSPPPD